MGQDVGQLKQSKDRVEVIITELVSYPKLYSRGISGLGNGDTDKVKYLRNCGKEKGDMCGSAI